MAEQGRTSRVAGQRSAVARRLTVLTLSIVLGASACSLLAPSDAELRGAETGAGGGASSNGEARASAGESGTVGEGREPEAGASGAEAIAGARGSEAGAADSSEPGAETVIPFPGGSAGGANGGATNGARDPAQLLWLRADTGVTLTSGVVSAWQDQSGHKHHAAQTMVMRSPKRVTPVTGKLPWIEFDGVDDELDLPVGFSNFDAGLSLFAVVQETAVSSCPALIQLSNAPEVDDIDLDFDSVRSNRGELGLQVAVGPGTSASDSGRTIHFEAGSQFVSAPGDAFQPGALVTLSVVQTPSAVVELRVDGVYLARGQVALPKSIERMNNFIGRSLYTGCKAFHGRVGELMLYNRALSDGERAGIEQYLIKRWK